MTATPDDRLGFAPDALPSAEGLARRRRESTRGGKSPADCAKAT
jgi:hypothetical protein